MKQSITIRAAYERDVRELSAAADRMQQDGADAEKGADPEILHGCSFDPPEKNAPPAVESLVPMRIRGAL